MHFSWSPSTIHTGELIVDSGASLQSGFLAHMGSVEGGSNGGMRGAWCAAFGPG
jgi:hypothetical protein